MRSEAVRGFWGCETEESSLRSRAASFEINWNALKAPSPECAASSVWISVAKVTRERGALLMQWRCTFCAREWTVGTARHKRDEEQSEIH